MTQKIEQTRLAMTAIAAVLALTSTPLLAQEVPDPVVDTTVEPTPATPDPLAPEPTTTQAPAATAPADEPASEPAPVAKTSASKARAAPAARRSASPTRTSVSNARAAPPELPAASAAEIPAETPLPVPVEAIPPVADPIASPPADVAPAEQALDVNDALPIAGAAGLGLLALAGAGLAVRRRRRRLEEAEYEERQWALDHVEPEPAPVPQPAFVRPAVSSTTSAPSDAPTTALPAGFDILRFGRHVQAAYRGPTPDNPSLSLKNRLRRASFFDQQERRAAEHGAEVAKPATQPTNQQPAWASRAADGADFMFRPVAKKPALKRAVQS